MWQLWRWAGASNERAVENARVAAVECSRRRVERAEVELFLASLRPVAAPAARGSQHPA